MKRALLVLLAVGIWSCGDKDPASSEPVEADGEYASRLSTGVVGREWVLQEVAADGGAATTRPGVRVTLQFGEDGQVTGTGGCNAYSGTYEISEEGKLTISEVGSTEMACSPAEVMDLETRYLRALGAVVIAHLSEGHLELLPPGETEYLRFAVTVPDSAAIDPTWADTTWKDSTANALEALVDRVWQLRYFEEMDGSSGPAVAVPDGIEITMRFSADGRVSGAAGCNQYFATYRADEDGGLVIGEVGITEMFCQTPDIMAWEDRFRPLLTSINAYRVEGQRLVLAYGDEAGILHLSEADVPVEVTRDSAWVDDYAVRYAIYPCADKVETLTRSGGDEAMAASNGIMVVADGNDLIFRHVLTTYCNAQSDGALSVEPSIDGKQITLNEVFRGPAVRCVCPIPIGGTIEDLAEGTYTVTIAYSVEIDGVVQEAEVLYETEVTVGDSAMIAPPWTDPLPVIPRPDLRLTASDAGDRMELSMPGVVVEVALEANPSTGFVWQVAEVDSAVVRYTGESFIAGADSLVGAPGTTRLWFEAIAPGETTLRLVYSRPWESVQPLKTFEVTLVINGGIVPPDPVPSVWLSIQTGASFGMCMGYCRNELYLDEEAMVLVVQGWDEAEYPERRYQVEMDPARWKQLVELAMADLDDLAGMEDVIGCPDCADGGSEWVTLSLSGRQEKVTFEHGAKLEPIAKLLELLRTLRTQMLEQAEE